MHAIWLRFFPIVTHHCRQRSKIERIFVAGNFGAPLANAFAGPIVGATPDVHLHNAVAHSLLRMEGSSALIHLTSMIELANVSQDCAQTIVGMTQILL
jgi:hypothetical protein